MRKSLYVAIGLPAALAAFVISSGVAQSSSSRLNRGTEILHFFVRQDLTRAEGESNAVGRVDVKQNKQGHADNQRLELLVQHLEPEADYHLLAWLGDDTNATYVSGLTTDANGALVVRYRQQANGRGQGYGNGRLPLPAVLDPLHRVRELAVANANTQVVASADLTLPDKLHYLIKRGLTNDGVDLDAEALLRINASSRQARLRLWTVGLEPGTNYWLALNGDAWRPLATDERGRAYFSEVLEPDNPVLRIHELSIWNSESNSVLHTTLP
jgi:hypothetical protein